MRNLTLRTVLTALATAAAAAFMLYGTLGLHPLGSFAGSYGETLARVTVAQRHALNVATAINFDYRGFDTVIEEYILFTAVAGVTLLFREQLGPHERVGDEPDVDRPLAPASDGLGWISYGLVPMGAVFAIYIAIHGALTPGGGFQAGAIAASVFTLLYLGLDYGTTERFLPREAADVSEAFGAAGFVLVGVAGAVASGVYLANVLPLGTTGGLASGGTIPIINGCVFVEVGSGLIVAMHLFLDQTRKRKKDG